MNPAKPCRIVLVHTLPRAKPPTCDPALDLDTTTPEALTRYARERTDEARAALAWKPGTTPVLFEVLPLSSVGWRFVQEEEGDQRAARALALCCHRYTDERGVLVEAAHHGGVEQVKPGLAVASESWVEHIHQTFGACAVREIAQVAIDRAEAGPRALAPFVSPRGLMLPL